MMKFWTRKQNIVWAFSIVVLIVVAVILLSELSEGGIFSKIPGQDVPNAMEVSLVNLITNPQKYDGKLVRVTGVGYVGQDQDALYLSKEDYRYVVNRNAVYLDLKNTALDTEVLASFNGKYVVIEGIFYYTDNKSSGYSEGTIQNITRYELSENIIRE